MILTNHRRTKNQQGELGGKENNTPGSTEGAGMKYWGVLIGSSGRKARPSPSLKPSCLSQCARRASISWTICQSTREHWAPNSPLLAVICIEAVSSSLYFVLTQASINSVVKTIQHLQWNPLFSKFVNKNIKFFSPGNFNFFFGNLKF